MKLSLVLLLTIFSNTAHSRTVRIAVIDKLMESMSSSNQFEKEFYRGYVVAFETLKKNGLEIEYRFFEYTNKKVGALLASKKASDWKPDIVFGPRISSEFYHLKHTLKGVLTVSPLATSSNIAKMPHSFYSTSYSNRTLAMHAKKALELKHKFKLNKSGILYISDAHCLSCEDFITGLNTPDKNGKRATVHYPFQDGFKSLTHSLRTRPMNSPVIISLFNENAVKAIARIQAKYSNKNFVYIGADGWSDNINDLLNRFTSTDYQAIKIGQWPRTIETSPPYMHSFLKTYKKTFRETPRRIASYISYYSVINIFKKNMIQNNDSRLTILEKHLTNLKNNTLYAKFDNIAIFYITRDSYTQRGRVK